MTEDDIKKHLKAMPPNGRTQIVGVDIRRLGDSATFEINAGDYGFGHFKLEVAASTAHSIIKLAAPHFTVKS